MAEPLTFRNFKVSGGLARASGLWALVIGAGAFDLVASSAPAAVVYNRNAAVSYANQYWDKCVSDGYFWINGSTYNYYGAGSPVPVNVSGEAGGIGDDCAHFVSSCVGKPAGGLSIATRVPPTYGEPGAARLDQLLINDGYAQQVSSVSQLTPGDVIGYDWDGSGRGSMGGIDHTVIYLGNNQIAAHATSHDGVQWNWGNSRSTITFFVHMTLHDSIVPDAPMNTSPAANASVAGLAPTLFASPFSDGALGSTHVASQWQLFDSGALVYDTGADSIHLLELTVPDGRLTAGNAYGWKVRYEDNYGDWSSYSNLTNFSIPSVPEPSCALIAGGSLLLAARRGRRLGRRGTGAIG
jgi:hypothetical protein